MLAREHDALNPVGHRRIFTIQKAKAKAKEKKMDPITRPVYGVVDKIVEDSSYA